MKQNRETKKSQRMAIEDVTEGNVVDFVDLKKGHLL